MNLKERQKLFENPTPAYRGKPFWSWNGKLEGAELIRQIDIMKEMGFGGFFMHSRTGLETEYLGDEWFEYINQCTDYGTDQKMEAWLYDEDRWPSGSAGGLVTINEKYRAMFIKMEIMSLPDYEFFNRSEQVAGIFVCRIINGQLRSCRRIEPDGQLQEGETIVVFTLCYAAFNDNYNGYTYADTMNREAVDRYIELTHEKYREKCGERLGKEVLGIFTDEPHRGPCFSHFSDGDVQMVPYTPGLFDIFRERFGYRLEECLPELFLKNAQKPLSKVTRDYFELCQELFIENFAMPIQQWCQEHNLLFTGHVLHEDSLSAQSVMQGSLMRFYEYMDYPGVDVLCENNRGYWIVKQIASVARQLNKPWVLSELYGCTGWQMDFNGYKHIGDWQALFGINLRCPHLSWYTMKGEAKRDYPASILHQSPWYKDYSYLEDYYSRIHAALHEGHEECSLLVLNPIESVWARAYSGSFDGLAPVDTGIITLEKTYLKLFRWLTGNQIDFDYGEEDIIARHSHVQNGVLYVGKMAYTKVLVGGMETMRSSTLKLLEEMTAQGGEVIFAGKLPGYVDVRYSKAVKRLAEQSTCIAMAESAVAWACHSGREVRIESRGQKDILVQSKIIEGGRMVMLLNINWEKGHRQVRLNLGSGAYLELWDARTGQISSPEYVVRNGEIIIEVDLEAGGERLLLVSDEERSLPKLQECDKERNIEKVAINQKLSYTLTEKNICVLDYVDVYTESGFKAEHQEVLKADRALRDFLNIPCRGGEMLQPWFEIKFRVGDKKPLTQVHMDFTLEISDLPQTVELAVEDINHIQRIMVNGIEVARKSQGKWLDICFERIAIADQLWITGKNQITLTMDYYKTSGLEAVYLLGNFGVEIGGQGAVLTKLRDRLDIGDITGQGLPFYSGSIIYQLEHVEDGRFKVQDLVFGGSLVKLLGKDSAIVAFEPFSGVVDALTGIEVVLTRRNTFGPLHQVEKRPGAYGPGNFVTEGADWTDDYQLYEQGLLKKPVINRQF